MAPPINEVDVDYDAQIQEIRRLISSTSDPDRRLVLEEQLRELEIASVEVEQTSNAVVLSARQERRKSFRPTSAKPRMILLPLTEDKEVLLSSTALDELDSLRNASAASGSSLVLDVLASSFDEQHAPANVLLNDHHCFWMTSGGYPQFLRVTLREPVAISEIEITFRYVRKLKLRTSSSRTNTRRMTELEFEAPASEGSKLCTHCFPLLASPSEDASASQRVEVIEVGLESAFNDFAIVYLVRFRQNEGADG